MTARKFQGPTFQHEIIDLIKPKKFWQTHPVSFLTNSSKIIAKRRCAISESDTAPKAAAMGCWTEIEPSHESCTDEIPTYYSGSAMCRLKRWCAHVGNAVAGPLKIAMAPRCGKFAVLSTPTNGSMGSCWSCHEY